MADTLTTALRKVVQGKLLALCPNCFYQKSKQGITGSWLVYTLDDFNYEENLHQVQLVVNVFDVEKSSVTCEELADSIWTALDHWYYIDEMMSFTVYQSVRNIITEDNKTLNRRRLVFTIRLFH